MFTFQEARFLAIHRTLKTAGARVGYPEVRSNFRTPACKLCTFCLYLWHCAPVGQSLR